MLAVVVFHMRMGSRKAPHSYIRESAMTEELAQPEGRFTGISKPFLIISLRAS